MPSGFTPEDLEQMKAELAAKFSPLTADEYQEILEMDRRGELKDLADTFAEAAGVSREEWLRRVAAVKASRSRTPERTQ